MLVLNTHRRLIAVLLTGCLLHAGPVAAYLCVDHQSQMASCCPGDGHEATDHGMMLMGSDSGLVSNCDPVTTDEQSSGSQGSPDPVAVGVDLLSLPVAAQLFVNPDTAVARLHFHGPPVYLSTLRVRL